MVAREYPPYVVGGVAIHTQHLVRHMRMMGVDVDVLSFGSSDKILYEDGGRTIFMRARSSIVSRVDEGYLRDMLIPLDMARYVGAAAKLIKAEDYDVVHVQEPYLGGPISHDAKVTTIHDTSYGELRSIISSRTFTSYMIRKTIFYATLGYTMEFTSISNSRAIITPSPQVRDELIHIYRCSRDKVFVIPNGVEKPGPNEPSREEAKRKLGLNDLTIIFTTAQHIARKRLDVLLKAAAMLKDKWMGRAKILIGGDGPLTPQLKKMAAELGLQGFVEFTGWIPDKDLPTYYRASDIFVITSDYEAGPQTLLEAGIRGCALVTSKIPFFPALIKNNTDGITFKPRSHTQLAKTLNKLLTNKELREKLQKNAIKFASKFTWDKIAEQTIMVYRTVKKLGNAGG